MSQQQVSARKQQELQAAYSNYKDTLQAIASKIGDVEQEVEEHKLVLETLQPLPESRKCFRMINGVLVERTVKDVMPQLQTNSDGLKKVLDDLLKQYTSKQEELEKWKIANKIQDANHLYSSFVNGQKLIIDGGPPYGYGGGNNEDTGTN
ncbi:hypothetical protein CAC42_4017 [Sphaceloma murrayae]|uniref:Prefoldin subunit 2 n=1 Tax=Sphaceloma murrayae TaxID=2082308 RepID=A0A2K1QSJ8_9PEZI|nr:hypothetical protein CAC42_4017 [Sphaceloma murrayae]